jgi:hypothetical protein
MCGFVGGADDCRPNRLQRYGLILSPQVTVKEIGAPDAMVKTGRSHQIAVLKVAMLRIESWISRVAHPQCRKLYSGKTSGGNHSQEAFLHAPVTRVRSAI